MRKPFSEIRRGDDDPIRRERVKEIKAAMVVDNGTDKHFYTPSCRDCFIEDNQECEGAFWCTYCNQEYEICTRSQGILSGDLLRAVLQ